MESTPSQLRAPLGFTRAADVAPDEERPGLLRARTLSFDVDTAVAYDFRSCVVRDCVGTEEMAAGLPQVGFEAIDLSANVPLQAALATVRAEDRLSETSAATLRECLNGAEFCLTGGKRLRFEHVAEEGMIHRRAGPNGLDMNPGGMDGANDHDGASTIHADQDVYGTPLKQLMQGNAPQMFRHQTPDGRNDESERFLLNLWIPIQQITRPLVLMDRRTLDAKRHQLRYGLPVTGFLDREEESEVNDIWSFLPDPAQAWYFRSIMGPDQGYVFDTLGEPHGSCILPGEDVLEWNYHALSAACDALSAGDEAALRRSVVGPVPELPELTTAPVREAAGRMAKLLDAVSERPGDLLATGEEWIAHAQQEMDAVIRRSVEMRVVATLGEAS